MTSLPPAYACPGCHRIVDGLLEVSFAIGLVDCRPELMCASCLGELRTREADYAAGRAFDIEDFVWAVEVVRTIGGATAQPPAATTRPTHVEAPKPRRDRAVRGGVGV